MGSPSRLLEQQGLLVRDYESAYLALDAPDDGPMDTLIGHSVIYRIGPTTGRKVLTLQTLSAIDKPFSTRAGNVAGVSLHAGVAARANGRYKLEPCAGIPKQYVPRPSPAPLT